MAARQGNLHEVKSLVKEGADINIQDNNGASVTTICEVEVHCISEFEIEFVLSPHYRFLS